MAKAAKPDYLHAGKKPRSSAVSKKGKRTRVARRDGTRANSVDTQAMTPIRWKKILTAIANGISREEAVKSADMTIHSVEAYLISNVASYKQLRDATLIWTRRQWPAHLIELILDDLATGMTLNAAALKNGVSDESKLKGLRRLIRKDKQIKDAYDEARELQAESFLDEIIDISDDNTLDRLDSGKIDHEVVNRSKLKIDTRRFAMRTLVRKRFGDTKQIELDGNISINHVALLTGARKRLENANVSTKLPPIKEMLVIDNDTGEIASADSESQDGV